MNTERSTMKGNNRHIVALDEELIISRPKSICSGKPHFPFLKCSKLTNAQDDDNNHRLWWKVQ